MKGTMHKCLSAERSSCLMETEHLHWPLLKMWKNLCYFIETRRINKKCPINETPKFGFPLFTVLTEIEEMPLWTKWKNGCHFVETYYTENFQLTTIPATPHPTSPQCLHLGFSFFKCRWKWKICVGNYEKMALKLPKLND